MYKSIQQTLIIELMMNMFKKRLKACCRVDKTLYLLLLFYTKVVSKFWLLQWAKTNNWGEMLSNGFATTYAHILRICLLLYKFI